VDFIVGLAYDSLPVVTGDFFLRGLRPLSATNILTAPENNSSSSLTKYIELKLTI